MPFGQDEGRVEHADSKLWYLTHSRLTILKMLQATQATIPGEKNRSESRFTNNETEDTDDCCDQIT